MPEIYYSQQKNVLVFHFVRRITQDLCTSSEPAPAQAGSRHHPYWAASKLVVTAALVTKVLIPWELLMDFNIPMYFVYELTS